MCDCIDKISKSLDLEYGDNWHYTNLASFCEMKTGDMVERPSPLRFRRPATKDGKQLKRTVPSYIGFIFCPFCGVKY